MLHRHSSIIPAAVLLALAACSAEGGTGDPTGDFFDRSPWHDGQAEVNFYEATEFRYGEPREAEEAVLIFVKEDHLADKGVKADDPADADIPVVKLNWSTAIPTGIYTYRQQASVFVDRRTNRPLRQTLSSHEWCGNTFKDLRSRGDGGYRYTWTTYFEQQSEGAKDVAVDGDVPVVLADGLPAYLRAVRRDHTIAVLPSLRTIQAEADAFEPRSAEVRVRGTHQIRVPAGTFQVRRIEVAYSDDEQDVFLFESNPRRRLVRMTLADGSEYRLRLSRRVDYWNQTAPGDERLREGVGVE